MAFLIFDTKMGIAGDMTIAALLDLTEKIGVNIDLLSVYEFMSNYGTFRVEHVDSEPFGKKVFTEYNGAILSYTEARNILHLGIKYLNLDSIWKNFALRALELLIAAETKAHANGKLADDPKELPIAEPVQQVHLTANSFTIIGYTHSEVTAPPLQADISATTNESYIEIVTQYLPGLKDLKTYDQIWVVSYLHKSSNYTLQVFPPWDDSATPRGVFSSRSPHRPSPIGLTRARIIKIEGNRIYLNQLDLINGTPILDIKPVLGDVDHIRANNGWVIDKKHIELHNKGIPHLHDTNSGHLHEAADIIIDILTPAYLLNELNKIAPLQFAYIPPIQVGGGTVTFSHGTLTVPAPATQHILDLSRLYWEYGPVQTELLTPTGIALLTALNPIPIGTTQLPKYTISTTGYGYGHKELVPTNVLRLHYSL